MAEIIKTRTIRPSSRQAKSTNYKIDTTKVGLKDVLKVKINHESKAFTATFTFNGSDISGRKSIHFSPSEQGSNITIKWSSVSPASSS